MLYFLGCYARSSEFLKQVYAASATLLNATCNYLNGTSNEWYFLPGGILPAVAYPHRQGIEWTYNSYRNTLVQSHSSAPFQKCDWLSTILHMNGAEYVLDDWIRTFHIGMDVTAPLTPEQFVNCWSIAHTRWAYTEDDVTLHIIDSDGDSHTILVEDPDMEEWNRLLPNRLMEDTSDLDDKESVAEEEDVAEDVAEEDVVDEELSPPLQPIFNPEAAILPLTLSPVCEPPVCEPPVCEPPVCETQPLPPSPPPEQEAQQYF